MAATVLSEGQARLRNEPLPFHHCQKQNKTKSKQKWKHKQPRRNGFCFSNPWQRRISGLKKSVRNSNLFLFMRGLHCGIYDNEGSRMNCKWRPYLCTCSTKRLKDFTKWPWAEVLLRRNSHRTFRVAVAFQQQLFTSNSHLCHCDFADVKKTFSQGWNRSFSVDEMLRFVPLGCESGVAQPSSSSPVIELVPLFTEQRSFADEQNLALFACCRPIDSLTQLVLFYPPACGGGNSFLLGWRMVTLRSKERYAAHSILPNKFPVHKGLAILPQNLTSLFCSLWEKMCSFRDEGDIVNGNPLMVVIVCHSWSKGKKF